MQFLILSFNGPFHSPHSLSLQFRNSLYEFVCLVSCLCGNTVLDVAGAPNQLVVSNAKNDVFYVCVFMFMYVQQNFLENLHCASKAAKRTTHNKGWMTRQAATHGLKNSFTSTCTAYHTNSNHRTKRGLNTINKVGLTATLSTDAMFRAFFISCSGKPPTSQMPELEKELSVPFYWWCSNHMCCYAQWLSCVCVWALLVLLMQKPSCE